MRLLLLCRVAHVSYFFQHCILSYFLKFVEVSEAQEIFKKTSAMHKGPSRKKPFSIKGLECLTFNFDDLDIFLWQINYTKHGTLFLVKILFL